MTFIPRIALAALSLAAIGGVVLSHNKIAVAAQPTAAPYTFVTVDVPVAGAASTSVFGINNKGDIVGSYNFIPHGGGAGIPAAFLGKAFVLYADGRLTTIDGPGPANQLCNPFQGSFASCYYVEARGINDHGDVVGTWSQDVFNPNGGLFHAFSQKAGGQFNSYLFPGHDNTIFNRVTDSGVIYGCYHDWGIDDSSQDSMHAITNLLEPNGNVRNLAFNPENSSMNTGGGPSGLQYSGVAYDFTALRHRGFVVTAGRRIDFDMPGSNSTQAWDMNGAGDVVGVWGNNPNPVQIDGIPFHGFVRDRKGNFLDIEYPGSIDTHVLGINEKGDIVGSYVDAGGNMHGFIASPGDKHAEMLQRGKTGMINASQSKAGQPMVQVAMMSIVPRNTPLLAPKQTPSCHRVAGSDRAARFLGLRPPPVLISRAERPR